MEAQSEPMLEMFLKGLSVRNLHRVIFGLTRKISRSCSDRLYLLVSSLLVGESDSLHYQLAGFRLLGSAVF